MGVFAGSYGVTLEPTNLFERADAWVATYANGNHLRKTMEWLRVLDPASSPALFLAGLLHDMERAVPGPDRIDFDARLGPADPAYNKHHSERSARVVGDWLREQGAPAELIGAVARLIVVHEDGGWPEADLLQAADSLSYFDVNVDLLLSWLPTRRFYTGPAEAREKLDYTLNRIRVPRARVIALPMYEHAVERLNAWVAANESLIP